MNQLQSDEPTPDDSQDNQAPRRRSRPPRDGGRPEGPAGRRPGPAGPPGRAEDGGVRCRVRVGSADGVLAVVPHLLGFHPANSLVLLGISGPHGRIRLAFRYDLPEPPDAGLSADIAAHAGAVLDREHLTVAIVIGYGEGRSVTGVVDEVLPALRSAGIIVHDVLRVHDGRYWSYLCSDLRCCPPEGRTYDPAGHPAAAALEAAGLAARANRAALAGTLARATEAIEPMAQAVDRARRRAAKLIEESLHATQDGDLLQSIADAGRRSVRLAVTASRRGKELTDLDEIAWIGFALTDLRVRDDAWARMDPRFNEAHQRLWAHLVRMLPAEFVPAPASLLAFTAWQSGDGALASIAIERALSADPEYSMAKLIAEALQAGLPPSAARLPMSPKQVAATYARHRKPAPNSRRGR
jgi:hypothetical protein